MRRILGVCAGVAAGTLGALILGEYPFSGIVVLGAAIIFGLAVAEVVVGVGRWRGPGAAGTAAALVAAGLVWAAWISEGRDLSRLPIWGWVAVALGMATAAIRGWRPGAAGGSRTGHEPPR